MRLYLACALALTACAACATRPEPASRTVSVGFVAWPRTASECDYERPDRQAAILISTTHQPAPPDQALAMGSEAPIYAVKDAQLLTRPPVGEVICASLLRYRKLGDNESVLGFEIASLDADRLRLTPRFARVRSPNPVTVEVAIGAGSISRGAFVSFDTSRLDFGLVIPGGPTAVRSTSSVDVYAPGGGDILRLVALIREGLPDQSPPSMTDDVVWQTLQERNSAIRRR